MKYDPSDNLPIRPVNGYLISKSTTTFSVLGCDWHVRMYPFSISSCSKPQCTSISTSPSISLALQVQQTPPLQEKGRSAPCLRAASKIASALKPRSKSKVIPSSFTEILLVGPSSLVADF